MYRSMVLRLYHASESSGRSIKAQMLGPTPRGSGSENLGRGLRVCISNKFSSETEAASTQKTTL